MQACDSARYQEKLDLPNLQHVQYFRKDVKAPP